MFEQASKLKLRFKVANGLVSTEDLWSFSLDALDTLAKQLNKEIKESEEESFIKETTTANKAVALRFDIVKHIIGIKLAERDAAKDRLAKAERKSAILKIIAAKQDEALQNKNIDELLKELESLD